MQIKLTNCMIRSFRKPDAAGLAEYANNRRIWLNLRDGFPHPYQISDAEAFIERSLAMKPQTNFAICVDERASGAIGYGLRSDVERVSAEIGY